MDVESQLDTAEDELKRVKSAFASEKKLLASQVAALTKEAKRLADGFSTLKARESAMQMKWQSDKQQLERRVKELEEQAEINSHMQRAASSPSLSGPGSRRPSEVGGMNGGGHQADLRDIGVQCELIQESRLTPPPTPTKAMNGSSMMNGTPHDSPGSSSPPPAGISVFAAREDSTFAYTDIPAITTEVDRLLAIVTKLRKERAAARANAIK